MRNLLEKFVGYFMTGGIAALVDAGGFALLYHLSVSTLPAAIASFLVAAIVNFSLTCRFVFRQRPTAKLFFVFLLAALGGLVVNVCVTLLAASYFALDPRLTKIIGIGTAFMFNFMVNFFVVFRKKSDVQAN